MDFRYLENNNQIEITKYLGKDLVVTIPDKIEEKSVTSLGPKAFLSCGEVTALHLPKSVQTVGDWAFCHMKKLRKLSMETVPTFGRQVWKGCQLLDEIEIRGLDNQNVSRLAASGIPFWHDTMKALKESLADNDLKNWFFQYDNALMLYLQKPLDEGFVPGFVGWFDDGDVEDDRVSYKKEERKKRAYLVLQRLQYNSFLQKESQEFYAKKLLEENSKSDLLEALSQKPLRDDVEKLKKFHAIGGFRILEAKVLLEHIDMPEPEVTAFLLSCTENEGDDFFATLTL